MKNNSMAKRVLAAIIAVFVAFALAACSGGGDGSGGAPADTPQTGSGAADSSQADTDQSDFVEMTLSFTTHLPATNPSSGVWELLQQKIDERMGGKIEIVPYTDGSLLSQNDAYDGIAQGVADMGLVIMSSMSDRMKLTLLLEQPGIDYNCSTAASYVMQDYLAELKPAELDETVMLMPVNSFPNSIISKFPINSMDDLKGKQVRANGVAAGAVSAMGATPVSLSMPEIYEALRNGLIDACWIVPGAIGNGNLYEVADYLKIVPIGGACQLYVMNKDRFGEMPKAQQDLFMELVHETWVEFGATFMEDFSTQPMSIAGFQGVKELTYLDGDELQKWRDATSFLADEYAAELDAEGLDGSGALALARGLAEKYNAVYPISKENYMMWRE